MDMKLFEKLIETNSIYPNEHNLGQFLYDYLFNLGFKVEKQFLNKDFCENDFDKTRFNILAEKGNGEKSLLFYGHIDTVPIHDEKLWQTNPLKLTQDINKENIYYGLGVIDMKGGIFAILESVKNMNFEGFKLKIIFGVDEEYRSKGIHTVVKSNFLDDVELCIVAELGDAENIQHGVKNIILGRRGRLIIKLEIPGKSCHGANASLGINAITQASIIACEIDEKYQITTKHDKLPNGNQFVKYFYSEVSSLSIPDKAILHIDRHILPGENEKTVIDDIKGIINNLYDNGKLKRIGDEEIKISLFNRPTPAPMAYQIDENNIYIDLIKKAIISQNLNYKISYGHSVADENIIANNKNMPVVVLGANGGNEHGANEWVDISSIKDLIEIYKNIINNFKL